MEEYETYQVFTPTSVASINYIERNSLNARMVSALRTPGKQLVIFGHSGVGKSSLLRNSLVELYDMEIVTNCMSGMTFDAIVLDVFDKLNGYYVDAMNHVDEASIKGSIEASYFDIKSLIESSVSSTDTINSVRIVPIQLTPQRVADFLGEAKACWVLEDFHKMDEPEKIRLSQIMKIFMDKAVDYKELKIVALGAVNTGREVVQYDDEMKNRIAEIEVQLMSEQELNKILKNGEKFLNIKFDNGIKKKIVEFSNGLASVCHSIALYICESKDIYTTVVGESIHFDKTDLESAITRYMEESSDSIKNKFDKALKQKKSKYKNAELIFKALSKFPPDGAIYSDILSTIRDEYKEYSASNLTKNLEKLQKEDKGSIIMEDTSSGKYLFSEPLYRPFAIALLKDKSSNDNSLENSLKTMIGKLAYNIIVKELEEKYKL